ncbi:tetratricopeptide repeat protein [Silvibacterium acidisoli]|uniref:tetratricopeptide repeat protein n=1 Tax=Acidobacteriaceae bacterium ZG23-2 TaxID=2883246 RepID=UPI00406BE5D7
MHMRLSNLLLVLFFATASVAQSGTDKQQQAQQLTQSAQQHLRERRPDLAIPELEQLVALNPQDVEAQGNLGVLLFFQGQYEKSVQPLRAAVSMQPGLTKLQGLLGLAEKNTGDIEQAAKDMEAAYPSLQDAKFKTQVGLALVELYTATSDLDKAAVVLGQLRRDDPENKEVLYAAYRTYSDLTGEAILSLGLVGPDSAQMHQLMAHEESKRGDTNGAIAQYRKAIAIDPKLPGAHFELAELLNTADDQKVKAEAAQEYKAALAANPNDEKSVSRLAQLAEHDGNLQQAFEYYTKAVALQPNDPDANFGLAVTLISMKQQDKALPLLERAVRLDPTYATAHYRLATLYRQRGRTADAQREVEEYKKYRDLKEKLRGVYKEMQIRPDEIREEDAK